jgi:hypothetical protein
MAIDFFNTFGKTYYDFTGNNSTALVTNFLKQVVAINTNDVVTYTKYQIQDRDRPEIVSNLLYGDPKYHWTFFLLNNSLKEGKSGWPMSMAEFGEFIETEYDPYMFLGGTLIEDATTDFHYSTLPISESDADSVEILVSEDEVTFSTTDAKFVRKDFTRMGVILTRPSSGADLITLDLGATDSPAVEKKIYIKPKSGDAGTAWLAAVEAAGYPTETFTIDSASTKVVPLSYLPAYSYSHLKNSTYQFFSESDPDQPLSHYGVIEQNDEPPTQRITWYEYEEILNNRKRDIIVVKPSAIGQFESAYSSLLLN